MVSDTGDGAHRRVVGGGVGVDLADDRVVCAHDPAERTQRGSHPGLPVVAHGGIETFRRPRYGESGGRGEQLGDIVESPCIGVGRVAVRQVRQIQPVGERQRHGIET